MKVTITNDWFTDDNAMDYLEVGHTYDINELVHHESMYVRREAAAHGYGLEILVNDYSWWVRLAVAEQGYGLDVLINDEDYEVRQEVAWQGYGLDKLINDKNELVRRAVALNGYGLDILINDKYADVRSAVASNGYGLDILINDKNKWVRSAVASNGYGLDILINDKDWEVRWAVAQQGYGFDILINDDNWPVRCTLAILGYGLDVLFNDTSCEVRRAVSDYLKEHGYKSISDWAKANPDMVHCKLDTETTDNLKDFIYKVDDSNTLKAESSYESVEAFFDDNSKESYESNETLVILAADTKIPLIKLEKSVKDNKQVYKFIVDITNDDGDSFNVKSIITSKDKFSQLLESTINALNEYPQFSKYADDLENCL